MQAIMSIGICLTFRTTRIVWCVAKDGCHRQIIFTQNMEMICLEWKKNPAGRFIFWICVKLLIGNMQAKLVLDSGATLSVFFFPFDISKSCSMDFIALWSTLDWSPKMWRPYDILPSYFACIDTNRLTIYDRPF